MVKHSTWSVFGLALMVFVVCVGCETGRQGSGPIKREDGGPPISTGECTPECTSFQTCCANASGGGSCKITDNDPNNCGACGHVCASGVCHSGECEVDAAVDSPDSSVVIPGDCSPSCSLSQRCCGTTCSNREVAVGSNGQDDSSFDNCNGCGLACDPARASACSRPGGGGAAPSCMCGAFAQCGVGQACVTSSSGNWHCVDLQNDSENCGDIGHACSGDEVCSAGNCICEGAGAACGVGSTCCAGSCINTASDDANCGACGTACGDGTHCSSGVCACGSSGMACRAASGTDLGQVCCGDACVDQDASNCGGCGMACMNDLQCGMGTELLGGGGMHVCCLSALSLPIPGFPAFCAFGDGSGLP